MSDNSLTVHGGHYEHFDLFPSVFRRMKKRAFLILNVVQSVDLVRPRFPAAFDSEHMNQRAAFYATDKPDRLTDDVLIGAYASRCESHGKRLFLSHIEPRRTKGISYLLLGFESLPSEMSGSRQLSRPERWC